MKDSTKMTWKDWALTLLIAAIIIPSLMFYSKHEEKKLFDVTIQNGKYNLYMQSGEQIKGLSKDSLDHILMYEYQIGVK